MSQLIILPKISWIIDKLPSEYEFSSPLITFIGLKWKLTLMPLSESNSSSVSKYQLILKRISPVLNSETGNLRLSTCTSINFKTCYPQLQRSECATVSHQCWCIWNNTLSELKRLFGNYMGSQCIFSIDVHLTTSPPLIQTVNDIIEVPKLPACVAILCKDLEKLLIDDNGHSDIAFKCEDKTFCAHRAILAARSEVFAAMFRTDMKEARNGVVHITDIEHSVFYKLLLYMYTGKVDDLSAESARKLHAAADKYKVEQLQIQCALFIAGKYADENESNSEEVVEDNSDNLLEKVFSNEKLLKNLFQTLEWKELAERNPKLASEMCKSLLMNGI